MRRPASWKTIRNRFNQHRRELAALADKHRGKVEAYGRLYTITGKFTNDADCNAFLAKHPGHGLIALASEGGESIRLYTALLTDNGVSAND